MMSRLCALFLVAFLVFLCGCATPEVRPGVSPEELGTLQDQVREFMENPGYTIDVNNITVYEGVLQITNHNTSFLINPVDYSVLRAEFSGQDAVHSIANTSLHTRAVDGIQTFFQNDSFDPVITKAVFDDDRYEIEGPGMFFRVNATTGTVVSFRLIGDDSVQALNGSEQYAGAREALNSTL